MNRNDEMGPIAHVAIGYEGVSWHSPDAVTFMLMQQIIGSYTRGEGIIPGILSGKRSISEVAWRMGGTGCAENFSAFNTFYKDTGLFGWWASADEVAMMHLVPEMIFSTTRLAFSTIEEEVEQAKKELKTNLLGMLDNTTAIAEDIGRHLLMYGRRVPMAEFIKRLDAIDAEEVKRVAWKYLYDQEIVVTGIGPTNGVQQYWILQSKTQWLRY